MNMEKLAEIFGLTIQDQVKSDLQKKMEFDGWEYLENVNVTNHAEIKRKLGIHTDDELRAMGVPIEPITEETIRKELLDMGYSDVKISEGYDWYGNKKEYLRGVYVKK
jgi:hypothetical protein